MSHRFTQVRDAIITALQASPLVGGAGVNVFKARTRNVEGEPVAPGATSDLPAVSVYIGEDTPINELGYNGPVFVDTELLIYTDIWAETDPDGDIDAVLEEIRRRVVFVIESDDKVGLSFVHIVKPGGAEEAIRQNDDKIRASKRVNWIVFLRLNVPDEGDGAFDPL